MICPKAIISSRKSQKLQIDLWDWDPGMGIDNDDFLGRSVPFVTLFLVVTLVYDLVLYGFHVGIFIITLQFLCYLPAEFVLSNFQTLELLVFYGNRCFFVNLILAHQFVITINNLTNQVNMRLMLLRNVLF